MNEYHPDSHGRPRRSKWDTPLSMAMAPAPALAPPAPSPYPAAAAAAAAQMLEGQVSSLEAASAAAARINAMLISKGKLKLPPGIVPLEPDNKQKQVKLPVKEEKGKNETLVAEVEINEVPIQCRNMLTKGSTQEEISRLTGAAVSTRGRYMSYADRATNNMGERPLYLCVQGPTRESVDRAVEHIKALIEGGMQGKGGTTTVNRTRSRFSAATTGPAGAVNTRPQGVPIFSRPPAPGLGAQMRGPALGGDVRGPGLAGGVGGLRGPVPHPMVPPPAIQLAIQSAQSSGHYLQDKVFVGLEHADPSFSIKDKILGPGGTFLQHIRGETGANIYLRGRGSGFMEPTSGREAFENLYIYVTHPKVEGLQAAKKLCENLVVTIQSEYMTHQSQIFQRSAPAMAAAHMIAPPPRPAPQPLGQTIPQQPPPHHQQQQQQQQQHPGALALYSQAQPTIPAASTVLSQTLAAQQQAQAILGAQRPVVSAAVSIQQGIVYPHLSAQPQLGLPGQPGLALQARAPQPVPAPAPVPPPQRLPPPLPPVGVPAASQAQLYATHVAVSQGQQNLAQAHAQAAVQAAHAQVQAHAQAQLAQAQAQIQLPVQQQPASGGLVVGQPQQVLQQSLGPPLHQQQQLQQQPQPPQPQQPVKRRFREDLPAERPEHHPLPMTNLGVSPPGHSPLGIAGAMAGGQGSLLRMPGRPPEDRRLMPPPPNPQAMHEAARKRLMPPPGLDIHGGRIPSPDEMQIKRGRLVSYDTSGDSDEDEDAAGRARTRFDAGPRFQVASAGGYMAAPPPRGLLPPSSLSTSTVTSSAYYNVERREPGPGGSPFWMARN